MGPAKSMTSFYFYTMEDKYPKEYVDYGKIPKRAAPLEGGLYLDGEFIGSTPFKVYSSSEEFLKEKQEYEKKLPKNLKELKPTYQTSRSVGSYEIAKYLVYNYDIKTTDERLRCMYIYRDGIYEPGENFISTEIQSVLEELFSQHVKNEIIEKVKNLTLIKRDNLVTDDRFINLENGIYDLEEKRLIKHNPKYIFLNKIPVAFDSTADCPKIKSFLASVLSPDDIKVIQEWAGYALYRQYFIKKAIIFVGERDTGKSTLLNLLVKFIGEKNVSGVSLQRIATDKFASSQLYLKYLNIFDDLSSRDVSDNGNFKIAVGSGHITGEYKFGNQFIFKNYSKLTFACNTIPTVANTNDEAYFSRWIIIPFNKQIKEPNPFLLNEVTTDSELSGFLNFGLEGLQRLLKQRALSYFKDPDEIKEEMLKSGSGVANFAYDCLESADNEWMSKDEMYKMYCDYARQKELPIIPIGDFGKKLPKYGTYIANSKKNVMNPLTNRPKEDTGWRNVRAKKVEPPSNQGKEVF